MAPVPETLSFARWPWTKSNKTWEDSLNTPCTGVTKCPYQNGLMLESALNNYPCGGVAFMENYFKQMDDKEAFHVKSKYLKWTMQKETLIILLPNLTCSPFIKKQMANWRFWSTMVILLLPLLLFWHKTGQVIWALTKSNIGVPGQWMDVNAWVALSQATKECLILWPFEVLDTW